MTIKGRLPRNVRSSFGTVAIEPRAPDRTDPLPVAPPAPLVKLSHYDFAKAFNTPCLEEIRATQEALIARKPRYSERRALQIVDENYSVLNERTYRHGIDDDNLDQMRAELEKLRSQWETTGALGDIHLRIIDIPATERKTQSSKVRFAQ